MRWVLVMIDPTIAQSAVSTLTTLVGLICNWRQERGLTEAASFNEFLTWLLSHNFEKLHQQILASEDLQISLNELLREDTAELSKKLDAACSALASISSKIDALAPVASALHAKATGLSVQAVEILKYFAESGAQNMFVVPVHTTSMRYLLFYPNGGQIGVEEPRLLADDLATLENFGLIRLVEYNSDGKPVYGLTREGIALADQLPAVEIKGKPSETV